MNIKPDVTFDFEIYRFDIFIYIYIYIFEDLMVPFEQQINSGMLQKHKTDG